LIACKGKRDLLLTRFPHIFRRPSEHEVGLAGG
jgi:hypothetical protein